MVCWLERFSFVSYQVIFVTALVLSVNFQYGFPTRPSAALAAPQVDQTARRKINFISAKAKYRTPNPPGWEQYDGSIYTKQRGYGWLTDLAGTGWDSGQDAVIILPDGRRSSPRELGRLELANGHASHTRNRPVVFRIDVPDGWYRVSCASVYPNNGALPLVDERSVKFRAHDVVVAGSQYGAPLKIEGNRLVEGSGIVEAIDGHLRIVMGDPAYGGWTWSYKGPFWNGWRSWWGHPVVFANGWYQKITRTVDPGFHGFRLNSLEIERVPAPAKRPALFFRDFFNRDDSSDINSGIAGGRRWVNVNLYRPIRDPIRVDLYQTSLRLTGPNTGKSLVALVQPQPSPEKGTIRYSTRVSLFTGEGSKIHSGIQEAGLLLLGDPTGASEFNSTFVGVAFDSGRTETKGWVRYRVGNGRDSYRTNSEIPDSLLPFKITEGEYEIVIDHDVEKNFLKLIRINGIDITGLFTPTSRKQRISSGVFGLRASLDLQGTDVSLQQFYWYYRVENMLVQRETVQDSRLGRSAQKIIRPISGGNQLEPMIPGLSTRLWRRMQKSSSSLL